MPNELIKDEVISIVPDRQIQPATQHKLERYLERLAVHGMLNRAAREAGIAYSTVWRYRKENPEFEAAIQESIAEAVVEAEDTVFDLMRDPEVNDSVRLRAATFILRHHRAETYGKQLDIKHNHQIRYISNVPRPVIVERPGGN